MSGKTTLLRTVGINAVLALAGAPVRAKSLRISRVSIGATLRVQDSLLEGKSRFYAEILRVKQLVEIARGEIPLLFLMDELFHGTNSHDRVEGAHGVLEYLVGLGGVGLVTTHDLALAAIGDRLGSQATNVHFEDQVVEGELLFDYRLRPGRAVHGNALALMRAVGLEVNSAGQTSPNTGR
jgi:DNA mismatch repair ATPase MutS